MSTFEEEEHVIEEYSQIDEEELNTVEEEEEHVIEEYSQIEEELNTVEEEEEERVIEEYFLIDEEELNTVEEEEEEEHVIEEYSQIDEEELNTVEEEGEEEEEDVIDSCLNNLDPWEQDLIIQVGRSNGFSIMINTISVVGPGAESLDRQARGWGRIIST